MYKPTRKEEECSVPVDVRKILMSQTTIQEDFKTFLPLPPRFKRVLSTILKENPDIITMQELDHYHDFMEPKLEELGYEGDFNPTRVQAPCRECKLGDLADALYQAIEAVKKFDTYGDASHLSRLQSPALTEAEAETSLQCCKGTGIVKVSCGECKLSELGELAIEAVRKFATDGDDSHLSPLQSLTKAEAETSLQCKCKGTSKVKVPCGCKLGDLGVALEQQKIRFDATVKAVKKFDADGDVSHLSRLDPALDETEALKSLLPHGWVHSDIGGKMLYYMKKEWVDGPLKPPTKDQKGKVTALGNPESATWTRPQCRCKGTGIVKFGIANKYNGGLNDGVAIFWNTQKLEQLGYTKKITLDWVRNKKNIPGKQCVMYVYLRNKSTGDVFVVVTAHMKSGKRPGCETKCYQSEFMAKLMKDIKVPIIFACDFNSGPENEHMESFRKKAGKCECDKDQQKQPDCICGSGLELRSAYEEIELLRHGWISFKDDEGTFYCFGVNSDEEAKKLKRDLSREVTTEQDKTEVTNEQWRNAEENGPCWSKTEPNGVYTTAKLRKGGTQWKKAGKRLDETIDYIFYKGNATHSWKCSKVLGFPSLKELEYLWLPGWRYPSDHWCIAADLELRDRSDDS